MNWYRVHFHHRNLLNNFSFYLTKSNDKSKANVLQPWKWTYVKRLWKLFHALSFKTLVLQCWIDLMSSDRIHLLIFISNRYYYCNFLPLWYLIQFFFICSYNLWLVSYSAVKFASYKNDIRSRNWFHLKEKVDTIFIAFCFILMRKIWRYNMKISLYKKD